MSPLAPYVPNAKEPWNLAREHRRHWRASFGATWSEGISEAELDELERLIETRRNRREK